MEIVCTIIWLLLGIISVWRAYYSLIKEWYILFNEDKRKSKFNGSLKLLIIFSPIFIIGGLVSLLLFELNFKFTTWYFKISK